VSTVILECGVLTCCRTGTGQCGNVRNASLPGYRYTCTNNHGIGGVVSGNLSAACAVVIPQLTKLGVRSVAKSLPSWLHCLSSLTCCTSYASASGGYLRSSWCTAKCHRRLAYAVAAVKNLASGGYSVAHILLALLFLLRATDCTIDRREWSLCCERIVAPRFGSARTTRSRVRGTCSVTRRRRPVIHDPCMATRLRSTFLQTLH
jgi:hypothetical protein